MKSFSWLKCTFVGSFALAFTRFPLPTQNYLLSTLYSTTAVTGLNETPASFLKSPIVLGFDELSSQMGGSGKARTIWDLMRLGKNPLTEPTSIGNSKSLSLKAKLRLKELLGAQELIPLKIISEDLSDCGTRKLLVELSDGGLIESVLIPR